MLDLKIAGGTIVDGSGSPRYGGDVGIKDGRIVALGKLDEAAHRTIDARGKIVAPGFVDVHTHYDAQVFWDATLSPSCYHGVTTVFGGFCGFSVAPLSEESKSYVMPMLARVEGMPLESLEKGVPWDWSSFSDYLERIDGTLAINAGFLVGHSTVRRYVMGPRAVGEQASDEELVAMKELVRQSIRGGALGFSTTLSKSHNDADGQPVPSRHATRREVLELASVVSEFEGTCAEILPGPGMDFSPDICELLTQFSLAAQRPINWNALMLNSLEDSELERVRKQLSATDYARKRGAEVIALTIPITPAVRVNLATGFMFDALPGWGDLFKVSLAERVRSLKNPDVRKELKLVLPSALGAMGWMAMWNEYRIEQVFSDQNRPYEGRTLGDIVAEGGTDALDLLIDVALVDDLQTIFNPPLSANESAALYRERAKLWRDDRTVIGASDAGAHLDILDTFALSTKLLSLAVRQYKVISLEDAVYNLTCKPAKLMGLRERGLLKAGWFADVVIFDPDLVGTGKVHVRKDLPAGCARMYAEAEGIEHVVINGREVITQGRYLGVPAGVLIKPGRNTYTVPIRANASGAL